VPGIAWLCSAKNVNIEQSFSRKGITGKLYRSLKAIGEVEASQTQLMTLSKTANSCTIQVESWDSQVKYGQSRPNVKM
jgi:hypothetical protein